MIKVVTKKDKREYVAFEISGHANSGPYGFDLVCAAVSAISFGAVNSLIAISEIEPIIEQANDGGYLYVELPQSMTKDQMKKSQIIIESMIISLETIEREYNQFIKIN
ncbi:MAG TPA: ribosomal-processing cysteine protease Prp [Pseudogracilibacillus sp.]|nr:ribosomal-processing cysteine protease Prp [Pseudogracilibacillus sp.]